MLRCDSFVAIFAAAICCYYSNLYAGSSVEASVAKNSKEYSLDTPEGPPSCVIKEAIDLVSEGVDLEQFKSRMKAVISRTFDTKAVALFIIGRRYVIPEKDFVRFMDTCMDMVISSYAIWFKNRKNLAFKTLAHREKSSSRIDVPTEIFEVDENGLPKNVFTMVWSVKSVNGTFLITDVSADGVSMRALQKDVIAGLIRKKRSFNKFLKDFLDKKINPNEVAVSANKTTVKKRKEIQQ
ncbi:MAG: ABC transporter substrate-binding protein [Holosporaceae bacterium]|jgi:ABC-type transporter MlaC component|nr:ABC transporter substrate-binding protein [Holosporaceae bacterium]